VSERRQSSLAPAVPQVKQAPAAATKPYVRYVAPFRKRHLGQFRGGKMKLITQNVSLSDLKALEKIVAANKYPSRAEAIRFAIHDLVRAETPRKEASAP
jgi:hypothetical protein